MDRHSREKCPRYGVAKQACATFGKHETPLHAPATQRFSIVQQPFRPKQTLVTNQHADTLTHATQPAASGKVVESSAVTSASGMDQTSGRNKNPKSAIRGPPAATTGSTPKGPPLTL